MGPSLRQSRGGETTRTPTSKKAPERATAPYNLDARCDCFGLIGAVCLPNERVETTSVNGGCQAVASRAAALAWIHRLTETKRLFGPGLPFHEVQAHAARRRGVLGCRGAIGDPPALRTLEDQLAATNDCRRRFAPYCLSSLRPGHFCWRPFQGCRQHRGQRSWFPQPHHRPHLQYHHRHHRLAPMMSSPWRRPMPIPAR